MTDRDPHEFGSASLEVRHVPESEDEAPSDAFDTADPRTGFVDVGVNIDGAFFPIYREKAGAVFKRIDQAKADAQAEQQQAEQQSQQSQ